MKLKENLRLFKLNMISKIRNHLLGKHAVGIIYNSENGILAVGTDDLFVGKELGSSGKYDVTALNELHNLITADSNICIVGTHIGALLISLAKKANHVVGYEANPNTFNLLQMNLKLNNINNCDIYNYAAGHKSGKVDFYSSRVNSGGSKIKPLKHDYAYTYDNPDVIEVDMIALDGHSPKDIIYDLIVMDIEGSEYFALQGMQRILHTCKHLQIEYVPHHLDNVSNVSNEQFLSQLTKHFNKVKLIGEDREYKEDEFLPLLNNLKNNNRIADLLFSK